jgi:hypothetical protein
MPTANKQTDKFPKGSFNPTKITQQVMTSNNVIIMLGIQEIAFGQGAAFNSNYNAQVQYGVGSQKPQEIQSQTFLPSVGISTLLLSNVGATLLNYPSTLGDLLGLNQFNIVMMGYNDLPMYTYVECTATEYDVSAPVNKPITEVIKFIAMDVVDISGISVLTGNPYISLAQEVSSILGLVSNGRLGNKFI